MRQHLVVFANFICKFGEKNLADYLREIILPAFTDDTLIRSAYNSDFHFLDVALIESLSDEIAEPAIAGQFVRDTLLRRTQVYDPASGELIPDEASLATSPSSFFVLLLRDHRLLYFAETDHAPDLKMFRSTIDRFILRKFHSHVRRQQELAREMGVKVSRKALSEQIGPPELNIVPITNAEGLKEFIDRFSVLKRVDITIHKKNDEISTAALIANADAYNEKLKGKATKISTSDPKGLSKEGTIGALEETADGANETVHLFGVDENGDTLEGDNEQFSVRAILDHLPGNVRQKAAGLYRKFLDLTHNGSIRRPEVQEQHAMAMAQALIEDGEA